MLLISRFDIDATDADGCAAFRARARRAVELLCADPGCLGATLGRSPDEPDAWVLVVSFTSIDAYRRALRPFPVREHVVPLLAEADTDLTGAFEVLVDGHDGTVTERPSLLA